MKPFKGVIKDWYRDCGAVSGVCAYRVEAEPMSAHAVLHNGIVVGERMHTSYVVKLLDFDTFAVLETRNSYYILIEPRNGGKS